MRSKMLKRFLLIRQSEIMNLGNSEDKAKFMETSMLFKGQKIHTSSYSQA